jgi:hypothetical protein
MKKLAMVIGLFLMSSSWVYAQECPPPEKVRDAINSAFNVEKTVLNNNILRNLNLTHKPSSDPNRTYGLSGDIGHLTLTIDNDKDNKILSCWYSQCPNCVAIYNLVFDSSSPSKGVSKRKPTARP